MLTPLDLLRNVVGGGLGGLMLYLDRSLWDLLHSTFDIFIIDFQRIHEKTS